MAEQQSKKKDRTLLALLLIGGAAWLYWYFKTHGYFPWQAQSAATLPAATSDASGSTPISPVAGGTVAPIVTPKTSTIPAITQETGSLGPAIQVVTTPSGFTTSVGANKELYNAYSTYVGPKVSPLQKVQIVQSYGTPAAAKNALSGVRSRPGKLGNVAK